MSWIKKLIKQINCPRFTGLWSGGCSKKRWKETWSDLLRFHLHYKSLEEMWFFFFYIKLSYENFWMCIGREGNLWYCLIETLPWSWCALFDSKQVVFKTGRGCTLLFETKRPKLVFSGETIHGMFPSNRNSHKESPACLGRSSKDVDRWDSAECLVSF